MATKRVAVYFLHEDEEAMAYQVLHPEGRVVAGGYLLGDVDEADLQHLEDAGIAVEEVDTGTDEVFDSYSTAGAGSAESLGLEPGGAPTPAELPDLGPSEEATWVVQVAGPLASGWRDALTGAGLDMVERVSPDSYLCRGTTAAADAASLHSFVQRLDRATVSTGVEAGVLGLDTSETAAPDELFDVVLDGSVPVDNVVAELSARGAHVIERGSRRVRIQASPDSPWLRDPRPMAGVLGLSGYVEPELLNDRARVLLGIDSTPVAAGVSLDGGGQIVAVTDTGLDETHPDFAGRVLKVIAHGRSDDASDPNGHGTHVAGSIVGTGAASNGAIQGIAPGAQLVFQSVLDSRGRLGGLRTGVHDLLSEAYALGARVFNHSWGALADSEYRADSLEVDAFCWDHPDAFVVVAGGNDGSAAAPLNAPEGFVDLHSLRAPATAKNALTVGAACSDRVDGPMAGRSWTAFDGARFPAGDVGDALISGDAQRLAGFSSRGPCQDRRIKPDVVAPGTDILSTRSSIAASASYWGEHPTNHAYAYLGGTSMAAPIVAGLALLVRQWYVAHSHQPSAALLKATLVNGCRWLAGADAKSSNPLAPNYDQGYGAVYLPTTLPNRNVDPPLAQHYVDTRGNPGVPALEFNRETDRPVQAGVEVGSGRPLRVCLSYTDPPGRFSQNDLTLIVEAPDRSKRWGNDDRRREFRGSDRDNTTEVVHIPDPVPGRYLVHVVAKNILRSPQGYALVVTGNVTGFDISRH